MRTGHSVSSYLVIQRGNMWSLCPTYAAWPFWSLMLICCVLSMKSHHHRTTWRYRILGSSGCLFFSVSCPFGTIWVTPSTLVLFVPPIDFVLPQSCLYVGATEKTITFEYKTVLVGRREGKKRSPVDFYSTVLESYQIDYGMVVHSLVSIFWQDGSNKDILQFPFFCPVSSK